MKIIERLFAFVCRVCPFCVVARRIPNSGFAKAMAKLEKYCPFCRAYARVYHR